MTNRSVMTDQREKSMGTQMDVVIDYTNHRGERRLRRIRPLKMTWGLSEWHPGNQWLLLAHCYEKNAAREFAMAGVHSWRAFDTVQAERAAELQVEDAAKLIYEQMPYDGPPGTTKPAWVPFGNSRKQEEARRKARTQGASPQIKGE